MRSCLVVGVHLVLTVFVLGVYGPAQAQYPSRPVQLIIPYGPGSSDLMGRITASCLATRFKQPVPVVNKPGANTQVGGMFVKSSPPDGHTLIVTSSAGVTDLAMTKVPTFDVRQDLEAITKIVNGKQGLYLGAGSPVKSIGDFLAYAKANPGKVNYGTTGIGSVNHLATEALGLNAGISMVHIPYPQGTGAVMIALMTNEIQFVMTGMSGAIGTLNTGKIRLVSVLEKERSPNRPDLPALVEQVPGMTSFTGTLWWGLFSAPKTPRAIVQKVHAEAAACLSDPGVRGALKKLGFEDNDIIGNPPDEFRESINEDVRHLKEVVQRAKLPLI